MDRYLDGRDRSWKTTSGGDDSCSCLAGWISWKDPPLLITRGKSSIVALRSGDLWHRELLQNIRAEMIRLGLRDAWVKEMGVAYLRFDADGSIWIW